MSVEITFLPQARTGLVAKNSYVVDAARRLGVDVPTDCGRRGECDSCVVFVSSGAELLSPLTEAETAHLDADKLGRGGRLACQARLVNEGAIVLRSEVKAPEPEVPRDISHDFRNLPLSKKLTTLFEFEAVTVFQALNALADAPFKAAEKALDYAATRGRKLDEQEREMRHSSESNSADVTETDSEN